MGFGLQDIQELTGYIEEMFSEYMTFPTILFIVAIVVALSSIACFILAPFYIKGKAGGAKTAAQVISVIDFIVGILLIFAFLIITLLLNIASDGFFNSADGFLKVVLGFMIAPVRFGMSPLSVFGSEAGIGTPILFYALYFVTAGLLGLAAFIVSCIARGKYNAANGLIRGAARTCGSTSVQPLSALRSAEYSAGLPSAVRTECSAGLPSAVRTECSAGLSSAVRTECSAGLSSAVRTEYTAGQRTVSACPAGSSAEYTAGQRTVSACPAGSSAEYHRRTTHSISLPGRKLRRIYRRTMHSISLPGRKFRRIYRRTTPSISLPGRKLRRIYRRTMHSISLPGRMHRRIFRRKMQIQKFPYSRLRRHSVATVVLR